MTLKRSTCYANGNERIRAITATSREVFMSLREFDRLLHAGKLTFNNKLNCWTEA